LILSPSPSFLLLIHCRPTLSYPLVFSYGPLLFFPLSMIHFTLFVAFLSLGLFASISPVPYISASPITLFFLSPRPRLEFYTCCVPLAYFLLIFCVVHPSVPGLLERKTGITKLMYGNYYWKCIYVEYRGAWWCRDCIV